MMTPLSYDQKDEEGIKLSKITEMNKIYLKPFTALLQCQQWQTACTYASVIYIYI